MHLPKFSLIQSVIVFFVASFFAMPVFSAEHPYLFFQADDLDDIRWRVENAPIAKPAFQKLQSRIRLDYKVKFPALDSSMRQDWQRASSSISGMAKNAAFCWLVTGEEKYLNLAKRILIETAENFDQKFNFHRFKDRSYMRIYFTGTLGLNMAWAYDMVYNDLSESERKLIEDKLLRGIVEMVKNSAKEPPSEGNAMLVDDFEWGPGQWNGVVYCNAGIAAIGFALSDEEIYEHAVDNYKTYIARDILSDGLFYEEDWHYAAFCIDALTLVAEAARNSGYKYDLYNMSFASKPADQWDSNYGKTTVPEGGDTPTRSLRDFYDAIVDCQYPNLASSNLGWQQNSARFTSGIYTTLYELAWRRFDGKPYGWILANMNRASHEWYCYRDIAPILFGDEKITTLSKPDTTSRVFNHGGWLVLKSIEGKDYWNSDSIYAFMPYGMPRSKGLQRLSLDIFAFGRILSPRVAKMSRHQSHDHPWYLNQPAWNNLMVDGANVTGRRTTTASSTMRFQDLDPSSPVKIAHPIVKIEYKERPSIWDDEISMRREDFDYYNGRALAITADYLLDISHVQYLQPQKVLHNFHWNLHGTGEFELVGAKHDQKVKTQVSAVWRYEDNVGIKSTLLVDPKDDGNIIYEYKTPRSSFIQAMRCGRNALVPAVHEPFRSEPEIDSIKQLWLDEFAVAVSVCDNEKYHDVHCFNAVDDFVKVETEQFIADVAGPYAFFRLADGVLNVRGPVKSFKIAAGFFAAEVKQVIINGHDSPAAIKSDGSILMD